MSQPPSPPQVPPQAPPQYPAQPIDFGWTVAPDPAGERLAASIPRVTGDISAFAPTLLPPSIALSAEVRADLANAEAAIHTLNHALAAFPIPNPHLFIQPFARMEAILSSQIEGTVTDMRTLLIYEAEQATPAQLPHPEDRLIEKEVANYVSALERGITTLEQTGRFTPWLIRSMHEVLLKGTRGADKGPGHVRTDQNWIGATIPGTNRLTITAAEFNQLARFVPPPPETITDLIDNLIAYINRDLDPQLHPLLRIAIAHYQFETIHPFQDGNGRVGRALIALQLHQHQLIDQPILYLAGFFQRYDALYRDLLLQISTSSSWETWLRFFLLGVTNQALDTGNRIGRLTLAWQEYQNTFVTPRRQQRVKDKYRTAFIEMLRKPIFAVAEIQRALGVTYQTAATLIHELHTAGFLEEVTGQQRNRLFLATPIYRIIAVSRTGDREEAPTPITPAQLRFLTALAHPDR